MATSLGVSSTLISQILAGDRQLTLEQGEMLTTYWGLKPLEADYFLYLLQYERAGTTPLKNYWKRKLDSLKSESRDISKRIEAKRVLTEQERAIFYSSPLYSAVRLYTSTSDRGRSIDELTSRFELTRSKALQIISFLRDAGLIEEESGVFKMGEQSTHIESGSPHLLKHHANWRIKAIQYADGLDESELMFTSPVSLSREDFDRLREKMAQFIREFLDSVRESPAEEIACFNMDFFWIKK